MADRAFCPYREWLNLPEMGQSPSLYQILGLPNRETDLSLIAGSAERAIAQIRAIRPGAQAEQWAELLDRLFEAREVLLNPTRKADYDQTLADPPAGSSAKPAAESSSNARPASGEEIASSSRIPTPPLRESDNPLFPPGMGPNSGAAGAASKAASVNSSADLYPPGAAPVSATLKPPPAAAQSASPAPVAAPVAGPAAQPAYGYPQGMGQPGVSPPTAYPAAYPAPQGGYGPQPVAYAQPGYAQPGYPAPGYPPAAYGQPPAAWPAPPQQAYYGQQPGGAYPQPMPQPAPPQAYPQYPGYGGGYAAPPAYAAPAYAQPPQPPAYSEPNYGYGEVPTAYALADSAVAGMSLDPMAPVAIPPATPGSNSQADAAGNRIVGFAAADAARNAREIPTGRAVAPAPASAPAASPAAKSAVAPGSEPRQRPAPQRDKPLSAPQPDSDKPAPQLASQFPPAEDNNTMLYWGVGGALVLLVAAIVYAVSSPGGGQQIAENNPHVPQPLPSQPTVSPPVVAKPAPPAKPAPTITPPPAVTKPAPEPAMPAEPPPPKSGRTPSDNLPDVPAPPIPTTPIPKPPEPKPAPMPTPPVTTPTPPVPTPTPAPMPATPEAKTLTGEQLTQLSRSLKQARLAMGETNFEEADKELAAARKLAEGSLQMPVVQRLIDLGEYAKQFHDFLRQSLTDEKLIGGAELVVGKTRVVVVEANAKSIILRVLGMNKVYPADSLPKGIALALAERKMDNSDPVGRIVKGAFYAVAKGGEKDDLDEAKAYWEQAQLAGANLGDLMQTLTDDYNFSAPK